MSLFSALNTAFLGLTSIQNNIAVTSQNISNASEDGYTKKTLNQNFVSNGDQIIGIRTKGTQRAVDNLLQTSLRTQVAAQGYGTVRSNYLSQLGSILGSTINSSSLQGQYSAFTSALHALSTSPDDTNARSQVISSARSFASTLNSTSASIQDLRTQTEQGIADAVTQANNDLQTIASLDKQIIAQSAGGNQPTDLQDQRDKAVNDLATLVDIKVSVHQDNSIGISTTNGTTLYDRTAVTLNFSQHSDITSTSLYNTDATKSGVGTIYVSDGSGASTDLIAAGAFKSGKIAGYISLRDTALPQAQAQLDELASNLSLALSDKTVQGTAVNTPPATASSGYALNVSGLQDGDAIHLSATVGGVAKTYTIVRVDDASKLPLANSATADPNDIVIGVSFAGGTAAAATALQTALGTGFQVSSPSAGNLQVLNDAANVNQVNGLSATVTETSLQGGTAALPFFVDGANGNALYTNNLDGSGQKLGFAARIAVNPALAADSSKLVTYSASISATSSDATRVNGVLDRLTKTTRQYAPAGGLGTPSAPITATVGDYLNDIINDQSTKAANSTSSKDGQDVVVNNLQARFDSTAKVNTDQELINLTTLQTSYQASAKVIQIINQLFTTLFQSA